MQWRPWKDYHQPFASAEAPGHLVKIGLFVHPVLDLIMSFLKTLSEAPVLLMDGAIETRIAFETTIPLDPDLEVYRLVGQPEGRAALEKIYRQYLDIGQRYGMPMQLQAPTFRASPARPVRADLTGPDDLARVNRACVQMLQRLRQERGDYGARVFVSGVLGPKGDAYDPKQALGTEEAELYHSPQAEALAEAGADLLYAATFPSCSEATGAARAMSRCGLPYVVGFVTTPGGSLLDGTPLHTAIEILDGSVPSPPCHYLFACVHASVCRRGMPAEKAFEMVRQRMKGIKANGSARPPAELEALGRLDSEAPQKFADALIALRRDFGFTVLGGCCGTDQRHLERLAAALADVRAG